ncbi:hypothetical protein VPH35_135928 [Triticum aestivum]|uniref:Uncharacterized protein n=1 Tax=Aegilops tauschii TaxID=37682 RepID=M8BNQ0_AEGTA
MLQAMLRRRHFNALYRSSIVLQQNNKVRQEAMVVSNDRRAWQSDDAWERKDEAGMSVVFWKNDERGLTRGCCVDPSDGHTARDQTTRDLTDFRSRLYFFISKKEQKKKHKHVQEEEEEEEQQKPTASFPEDILIDILSRVPYRSLCRFKCVSKEWLALCSDSDIRKRSPQTLSGFFYFDHGRKTMRPGWRFQNSSGKGAPMVDLDDLPFLGSTYKHFAVTQCSTSLLLCQCWISRPPRDCGWNHRIDLDPWLFVRWPEVAEFDYVVYNPATREWTVLPPIELPGHLSCSRPGKYILGFDPATPSRFVVFVRLDTNYGMSTKMIYSSETRGWTSMQSQRDDVGVNPVSNFGRRHSTLLNGTLHFPAYDSIVTLDMKRNAWREIKMPPGMTNNYVRAFIGQSQGHLYAWHIENRYDGQLSVWVLENYDSGQWTLKWVVNCFELFGRDRLENGKSYSMFAIHPECNLIFLTDGREKILSYNMDNQKVICTSVKLSKGLPYTPCFAEWTSDGQ